MFIMKTEQSIRQTYLAPDTSVSQIEQEQSILSATPGQLQDMDPNEMYDENF